MNLDIDKDIWQYLAESGKNIVMYGMGNGADKILRVCEERSIEICDFFASDGFVRGHFFHGKRVLSYSEAKEKYGAENMIVLLSFASSLPDVIENILRIASECELYAPDVPVFGDRLFDIEFYRTHLGQIEEVYSMLADEESRSIYRKVIEYKLSGRIELLEAAVSDRGEVYRALLRSDRIESAADLGAYNGDTLRELAEYAPRLRRAIALEPDKRNFKKLSAYAEGEERFEIEAVNSAAWSCECELCFDGGGNRNSNVSSGAKRAEVSATSLDSLLGGSRVDYIKYDVEGSEREALIGASKTIRKYTPSLLVSVYHRSEDIFALPKQIRELCPEYRLYLRRYRYIPAWDLNLICVCD